MRYSHASTDRYDIEDPREIDPDVEAMEIARRADLRAAAERRKEKQRRKRDACEAIMRMRKRS